MKRHSTGLIILTLLMIFNNSYSQYFPQQYEKTSVAFGVHATDPVHIKTEEKTLPPQSIQVRFSATNTTYYPFLLKVDFIQFENLSPRPPARIEEIVHGTTLLYTFSQQVENSGYGYNYQYSYKLKPSVDTIDPEYPYLIPLKQGKMVNSHRNGNQGFINSFTCNPGDTIYCMRKGFVTACPETKTPDFRLSSNDCLEVRHNDGTYMIYMNLSQTNAFATPGKNVYPGQPVGIVSDSSYLQVNLLRIAHSDDNRSFFIPQLIKYTVGENRLLPFNEIDGTGASVFPKEVISRELTAKEIRQAKARK